MRKIVEIFESVPYEVKDNNPKGDFSVMASVTPCPYIENRIVAGAWTCDMCRFNGGCNEDATVKCSYKFFNSLNKHNP